jgi:hypothetical protein
LGSLGRAPLAYLLTVALIVPMAAFMGGWLLAGRAPLGVARSVID